MLFVVVATLVYVFQRKLEHLTIEEAVNKPDDRITKLENEYSSLHAILTSQEERMKAATSQATEAQAFLHAPIDD
jgi:hypothetical protein